MSEYIGFTPNVNWRYPFYSIKELVRYKFKPIKWFLQRGWRGYADSDTSSVDWYIANIVPKMLTQMRDNGHGYPIFDLDIGHEDSIAYWAAILTAIIDGFEAGCKIFDFDFEAGENLAELQTEFDFGMELFAEYFFSLWD